MLLQRDQYVDWSHPVECAKGAIIANLEKHCLSNNCSLLVLNIIVCTVTSNLWLCELLKAVNVYYSIIVVFSVEPQTTCLHVLRRRVELK